MNPILLILVGVAAGQFVKIEVNEDAAIALSELASAIARKTPAAWGRLVDLAKALNQTHDLNPKTVSESAKRLLKTAN